MNRLKVEVDDDVCRYCELTRESAEHIVLECEKYIPRNHQRRMRIYECARELKVNESYSKMIVCRHKKMESLWIRLLSFLKKFNIVL